MTAQTIRISSSASMLAVIPQLLSFEPQESFVAVFLRGHSVVVTMRIDLKHLAEDDFLDKVQLVVEAARRSNAGWSATWAENLGRGLFAVPGPVTSATSQLPHQLIRDGRARLVTSAHDVLVDLTTTTEEN